MSDIDFELPKIEPLPKRGHSLWMSVLIAVSVVIILHALIFTTFSIISLDGTGSNLMELFARTYARTIYSHTVANSLNDSIVLNISSECQNIPLEAQAYCVQSFIAPLYHYVDNTSQVMILTPDETVEQGGVCRDFSVMTATIFRKLGWYAEYNFPIPQHVTVTVWHNILCADDSVGCMIFCEFNNEELEYCAIMEME